MSARRPSGKAAKASKAARARATTRAAAGTRATGTAALQKQLSEALEQQAASAEILRLIASSPTDVQPVFDAVVASAARLCDAEFSAVAGVAGDRLHLFALNNISPDESQAWHDLFPRPPQRGFIMGRAFVDGCVVHAEDVLEDPDYDFRTQGEILRLTRYRTFVAVPIVRDGAPIGVIGCGRREVRPFTAAQIELVRTFADQAAIAIENVRLVRALEERNHDLTQSLDQQTATSAILSVISRSQTDVQPVFDTIVESATRLCRGMFSALFQYDGELIHQVARHNFTPEALEAVRRLYPARLSRGHGSARAILDRAVVHIPDVTEDPEYAYHDLTRAVGFRSGLFVPMWREGAPVGVIMVARAEPGYFSASEIDLLKTFADQAVIAIENARLFHALEARNGELTNALEQQTATGDILRVISSSPTDTQPVFAAIARSARRLCDGEFVNVFRFDGTQMHFVAHDGLAREGEDAVRGAFPAPADRGTAAGRAIVTGSVVHLPDVHSDPEYARDAAAVATAMTARSIVAVPMLRDGVAIGAIAVARSAAVPFRDTQIDVLETFADQAVIAIENVRLFTELQARNGELTASLEQQTATSEILRVISSSPTDAQPVFDTIAESAARLCGAHSCFVFRFDGSLVHFVAQHGLTPDGHEAVRRAWPLPASRGTVAGRAILDRGVAHIPDVQADPGYVFATTAHLATCRATAAVPMLRDGVPIGAISILRAEALPFSDRQLALLTTFADQAVIAIENVRLFGELQARNGELTESLEQQTATSEILRVISSSPTDVQPVFDTIAESAARLCGAHSCFVFRFDGRAVHFVAHHGLTPDGHEAVRRAWPMPASRGTAAGRAILDRVVAHIPDVHAEPGYVLSAVANLATYRATAAVPMLRDGVPIGAISILRAEAGPFSDRQLALLTTFADQAVIAIENVRLFGELERRNADLSEALEQQTATGEILKVISSSPTDSQPMFDMMARSAARLCLADTCLVYRFDGEMIHFVAHHGMAPDAVERFRTAFPALPNRGSATGRAILDRAVAEIPDVTKDAEYTLSATMMADLRSTIAVPIMRDDRPVGTINLSRSRPGSFPARHLDLLRTFADQAAIAIENVRLFTEVQTRNRELTETLEQQTATGEILRVMSNSPTDVQPVLDTMAESAARLSESLDASIFRREDDGLALVARYGPIPFVDGTEGPALPLVRGTVNGRCVLDARTIQVADLQTATDEFPEGSELARRFGYRTVLSVPLVREGVAIGTISLRRTEARAFTDRQLALLETFADQAVIAIENVRLFQELQTRNRDLSETLEQQTATGEILRIIASSLTDVRPVFDTIAANALRLCNARWSTVTRFDGQAIELVSSHGLSDPGAADAVRQVFPRIPRPGGVTDQAILTGAMAYVEDASSDPTYDFRHLAQAAGYRSLLAVPMLRDGHPVGAITVAGSTPRAFSERQLDVLKTFADQAVIAIENVRLFQELQKRTADLTRSVSEQRALGEVSQAVSSTLDLETVLETIVTRAVQLSGSASGIVYEFDHAAQTFHARATHHVSPEHLDAIRAAPIRLGEGAVGRAGTTRQPVDVADIETEQELVAPQTRSILSRDGMRSLLALPLVREGRLLGGLVIMRRELGAFGPDVVTMLQTFATQSVLAIHNAGLFREIQRQQQYSEALVQTSPVAIATIDPAGLVIGWNPGAERLFGYAQTEAIGRHVDDLIATPEIREEVRTNTRHTLAGERIRSITRRARKDGTLVDVEVSSVPVVVEGAERGFIAIYHDISELLEARREAEAANEAKSAFLATMSHEIRTPMNAVIGMTGLLLNTPLTDEQRDYAEVVRQSGDALLSVINDILDFSKIEAGRLELESQPFDVRECLESALDLVATRAAEKGLDLAYLLPDGTPAAVVGDVTRLRQILLNLLSNAVKFTEKGEVVLSVSARRVDDRAAMHELTFSVRDTGIGIPPDRLDRLFQSFSQVDASTTRRYGGTGLGLAISQRLAQMMGGAITVSSTVGVGSEFRFTVRAAAAASPVLVRRDLTGVQPSLRGKRVLVVDDNATNRRILTSHLGGWGMQARATGSPGEALAWMEAGERFDLGILDMHMPEMDGVALARAIRDRFGRTTPLVLFTSLGRREARAEDEGFAAYLHKPIKPSQLFDTLVSVLADQPVHVQQRSATRTEFDPELGHRHPLRILLAEDNVVNQKLALRLLGQMGYRADVAANGLEAVDAIARQTYDVVLMDVQMPEMDGFEASREVNRRWPGAARPRIVAMTANAMEGDRELCVAAGMDDYVAKPIRVEELIAALERCQRRGDAETGATAAVGPAPSAPERPAESREPSPRAVDRARFQALVRTMGGAFVAELVDTYREDARHLVAALRRGLAEGDVDGFRRAAHSLKSNSETLGALRLAALARELETTARAGSLDGTGATVEQVEEEHGLVARELAELRDGLEA